MRTKTVVKFVSNLTPEEYNQCKSLNLRFNGCMRYDLVTAKKNHPSSRAVMIKDSETGKLIAWSLAYPGDDGKYVTQYYVRVRFRRQGYGDRLMRHVKKFAKEPMVMPHDRASDRFFRKYQSSVIAHKEYPFKENYDR